MYPQLTSWRYAIKVWASRLEMAAKAADWTVAFTIGGAMLRRGTVFNIWEGVT